MLELTYNFILLPFTITGLITFFVLLKVTAPYGKFSQKSWGPTMSYKLGWVLQEIISLITFTYFFTTGTIENKSIAWIFFILWSLHYFNRSIIFPLRKKNDSFCPSIIVLFAVIFNLINGFINGYYLGNLQQYDLNYIYNFNFIVGIILFISGATINLISDHILLKLKGTDNCYKIPSGFLYNYISCPNYFGEIVEWIGFAMMTWSFPGLIFALWTFFNLAPRAISHHKWYKSNFDNYPKNRKAIIPFIL